MTIREVKTEVQKLMFQLDSPSILQKMVLAGFTDSKKRIFTDGKKTDETPIGTYADSTKKRKEKKGRLTSSKINLRDTETLTDSYFAEARTKDKWVTGFANVSREGKLDNGQLVDVLEEKYGDIFAFTNMELSTMEKIRDENYEQIFK